MNKPSDVDIRNAIEYALRRCPIDESAEGDDGEFVIEITDPATVTPFVMCLLEELGVI